MSGDGTPELVGSRLEVADRVATLTFDRDDVRNELSGTGIFEDIVKAADWSDATEDVSVLVITGSGRSFSAGGNVKDMDERNGMFGGDPYEIQRSYGFGIQTMTRAMHRVGLPTIAAVNGAAIGAGFDLACMCDIRIAARGAKMGETFVNLGIVPGDGGAWILQRLVGYERAAELTLTGRVFDADEAMEMRIVSEVVEPDELQDRATALATTIASKPPRALRLTKRLLRSAGSMGLEDFLDLSASYQSHSHHNPEHREAVGRFVEGMRSS
jgi:enoyl-CoA hydratase/carnithine racemase